MTTRPYTSVWNDLAQVEFSQGFLQAGPYRTRYLHAGDRDKPVLLLLHGTGAATHSWRSLAPLLAEHFRVVAPDLPGHGFTSGRPSGGLAMPAVARSVSDLMGALALDGCSIGQMQEMLRGA